MEKKGVIIEIGVDTSKFDKKIKELNKDLRKVDTELRKVDKALKFNPRSVDLWRQKQQLLTQKVAETTQKLDQLKAKQAEMDAHNIDKNSEEYRKLQREIIETESKLKTFKAQLRELGNVNLKALGEQLKEIGKKMEEVGKTMTQKVTAPITAVYGASAKASLDYADAIAKMSTIADDSQVPIDQLKKQIIELSNETGKSATELAEAGYQALSAGVDTKDAVGFIKEASGLAKAGFLETAGAVDVLTTIINAYGYSAEDANMIASQLIQTQNDGKTTVNELAQAMGTVIPTASALNIPLEQLNASYVQMTKQGINTANATTYLNGMFTELADGGSDVSEILQNKTGKTFGQLMKDGATLGDVLDILNQSVNGDSEAFLNLWGNTRAGRGALSILNAGIEEFNAETLVMQSSTDNVSEALEKLDTTGAKARKALNMLVNAGIQIGDVLAPYIEKAALFLQSLAEKFNSLSPEAQKIIVIVGGIVAVIGPALLIGGKIIALVGTLMTSLSTIIGVIKAVGLAIGGLMTGALAPVVIAVGAVIGAFVLWKTKGEQIKAFITQFVTSIINAFNMLKANATTVFKAIASAMTAPITGAISIIKTAIDKIKNIINGAHLQLPKFKLPHFRINGGKLPWGIGGKGTPPSINVDWYAKGGIFNSPQVVGVGDARGGEAVVPLDKFWDKLDKMQSGQTFNFSFTINGTDKDKKEIAEEVYSFIVRKVQREKMAWQ